MSSLSILIVGNGGREHAIAWKLSTSKSVQRVFVAPGNGGTAVNEKVYNVPELSSSRKDFEKLQKFAVDHDVNLVVIGPEQPLADGITTFFSKVGIPVFGPSEKAARMEGSKVFSKEFMAKHNIPTAEFKTFKSYEQAKKHIQEVNYKVVIKADGIAGGKGVLITKDKEEALEGLADMMVKRQFGAAGDEIVIEEYLDGDELSILTFSDGYSHFNLPAAQDHKRIGDGDKGGNTGGMGAYAPAPIATPEVLKKIEERIIKPTILGMRRDGYPMCGMLFIGIMLTPAKEPKVLEYNVRFGDPESQTLLPLLSDDTDLAQVMLACAEHRLDSVNIGIKQSMHSTTVVMAAGGYPESYKKGDEITFSDPLPHDSFIFHAGTSEKDGKIVTAGGRVIAATAIGSTLRKSVEQAYKAVDHVTFKDKYFRNDIAHRAFKAADNSQNESMTYASAGVSVDNGNALVSQIKQKVRSTARPGADADIGGFGGLLDLKKTGYSSESLLVAATDGVGTKLRVAQITGIHNTVGTDLVAMNVNDLITQGAEPLIFLDYFATGKLDVNVASEFVDGVVRGCIEAGCALVGGETSEMPGMYSEGHYDANGTSVGAVERGDVLPKLNKMKNGDVLIGLTSDGIHSNGLSLVRRIVEASEDLDYQSIAPWSETGKTVGEEILVPTKIYVRQVLHCLKRNLILAAAHITGGGLVENIPRAIPGHLQARIDFNSWKIPAIFKWFAKQGNVPIDDLLRTFNMGIGMVLVVSSSDTEALLETLSKVGEKPTVIGKLVHKNSEEASCVVENSPDICN